MLSATKLQGEYFLHLLSALISEKKKKKKKKKKIQFRNANISKYF